jgi:hypothetical protein
VPARDPAGDDNEQLTGVGYVLTLLSVAVIGGSAILLVLYGPNLPNEAPFWAPVIIGASFFGISTVLLRLLGLQVWSKPESAEKVAAPVASKDGSRGPGTS